MRKQVEHWASSVQFRKPMDGPAPPLWSTKLHYGSVIQVDSDWELEWERLRMKQSLYRTPGLRKQNHSASVYNLWTNSLAALQQRVNSCVIAMRFTCSCDTQVPTWVRNQLPFSFLKVTEILCGVPLHAQDRHDSIFYDYWICRTFIEPVSKAIKHNSLFTSGDQADRSALYCCSVVDVVFKYEDLDREMQKGEPLLFTEYIIYVVGNLTKVMSCHLISHKYWYIFTWRR